MNEHKLVTFILWCVLAIGSVGLFVTHLVVSNSDGKSRKSPTIARTDNSLYGKGHQEAEKPVPSSESNISDRSYTRDSKPDDLRSGTYGTSTGNGGSGEASPQGMVLQSEATVSTGNESLLKEQDQDLGFEKETLSKDTDEKKSGTSDVENLSEASGSMDDRDLQKPPESGGQSAHEKDLQPTILEKSGSNGTFFSAQDILPGIIIGKRGTMDDRADFYRIQATGDIMALVLKPDIEEKDHYFDVLVFGSNQKPVEKVAEKEGPEIIVNVKAGEKYFLKLDLRHAPIGEPDYQLSIGFR